MAEHRAELQRAASTLGLNANLDLRAGDAPIPPVSGRWRWIVDPSGTRKLFNAEALPTLAPVALSISAVRVGSQNWDSRFKTFSYLPRVQALRMSATSEVILLNEHGDIASAARANIFWRKGSRLFSPAHEAGCRCGVVRNFVLQRQETEEGHFTLNDLLAADEIFLTNSLRGIVPVCAVEGKVWNEATLATDLQAEYAKEIARQRREHVA